MTADLPSAPPKFVILTLPRSGSYHLVSLLNSAPDIVCHGEIFKRDTVELAPAPLGKLGLTNQDIAARDAKPMAFLTRVRGLNGKRIVGFKMFPEHASRLKPLGEQVLRSAGWRKVFLTRNPIASYASLLRAKETGIWTVRLGGPPAPPRDRLDARVRFAPQSFDEHMQHHEWFTGQVRQLSAKEDNPCLCIDYDQVVDGSGLAGVLRFVGSTAAAETLQSSFDKQFSGAVSTGFSNWDALVAHARARGLEAALEGLEHAATRESTPP